MIGRLPMYCDAQYTTRPRTYCINLPRHRWKGQVTSPCARNRRLCPLRTWRTRRQRQPPRRTLGKHRDLPSMRFGNKSITLFCCTLIQDMLLRTAIGSKGFRHHQCTVVGPSRDQTGEQTLGRQIGYAVTSSIHYIMLDSKLHDTTTSQTFLHPFIH